uniref:Serpin B6 n=1 Tax=Periophthalmus magnuspinnatus TaxID=409849 RepID=A0A3B4ARL2_9GOBI
MGQAETSDSLSKANISFTLDLFKTLGNQNKTSNVSFSPFSVSAALSMLLLGAKGSTANQMRELEQQLTYESFVEWTRRDKMYLYQVDLSLPQFRIEQNYELFLLLIPVGMSPVKDLMVSQVVHRAFVDVNDRGTEAAAYTRSLVVQSCILPPPRVTFNADHPFIFFIRHNATSTILFAGRFCSEQ